MLAWIAAQFEVLLNWVQSVVDWGFVALQDIAHWIWAGILDGLATVIEAIPPIQALQDAGAVFGGLPASVVYFLDPFQIPFGLSVIMGALVARFILRRIPLIG